MSAPVVVDRVQEETASAPHVHRRRRGFDRPRWLWVVTGLTMVFLFAPIAVVVAYSFNSEKSLNTFGSWSLRWYRTLAHDADLLASLRLSLEIAAIATVLSVVLGALLAFGVRRGFRAVGRGVNATVLLRLVTPETATGVALLLVFTKAGITLSTNTVIISHVAFCIAYVAVIVGSRLATVNAEVEESAMDLGARHLAATRLVVLPLLWPAILGSALLSFVLSFDDFITSFFTSGAGTSPLPVRIYSMIRFGVTPEINAAGVLMLVITMLAIVVAGGCLLLLRRRGGFVRLPKEQTS